MAAFKQEMVYRYLAWVNILRLTLRGQEDLGDERPFLTPTLHSI
jgi:hypothetical protein